MKENGYWASLKQDIIIAIAVLLVSVVVAVGFNSLREEGIPLVAKEDYPIFVPCPETEEEAGKVSLNDIDTNDSLAFPDQAVLVDARSTERFEEGHIAGAISVPYDELEGVAEEDLARLDAVKGASSYIVYCDGWEEEDDPEVRYDHPPSEHLADELKSRGLSNVSSLTGGLAEYLRRGGQLVKQED